MATSPNTGHVAGLWPRPTQGSSEAGVSQTAPRLTFQPTRASHSTLIADLTLSVLRGCWGGGAGDPQRPEIIGRLPVFWGVPSDRRISAPAFASPVRVPRPHRSHCPGPTLHVDSDKAGHPGARMTHRRSCTDHPSPRQPGSRPPRAARGSVPAAGLTRSTTSLCRSSAFCFPLGVSEALDSARSCSSKSSRRPRSRCGTAAAGPWGRMVRGGPGRRGAGGGAGGDAEPGRDQSLAPPRSEAATGCINASFTRAPPSLPPAPLDTVVSIL